MINNPTIAIVIPCWNEEKLLPEMLDCLKRQSYKNWIAICVDDQSTDKTAEIITSYHSDDSRILYYRRDREPKGGPTCRNIGIEKAIGSKYLCFFDADDLVAPYCLEQRVNFMESHPELDYAVFPIISFINDIHEDSGDVYGFKSFDDDLQAMLNMNLPFAATTNIYRYEKLIKSNLLWDANIKSMQDSDYNIHVLLSGMTYAFASNAQVDYYYRTGREGVSWNIKKKNHYDSHLYLIDKIASSINFRYGQEYDFYIGLYVYDFLRFFNSDYGTYMKLLKLSWVKKHKSFKWRILAYMIMGLRLRSLVFRKYRNYSSRMTSFWYQDMRNKRIELIQKGYSL